MIAVVDPGARVQAHRAALDAAYARVLDSGRFILGAEVEAFETEFAAWLGTAWSVGVGNGTDALHVAYRALGIGPGDEVILPSLTATATGTAVVQCGATPVFADVDPVYRTIDPAHVATLVTPRTRAIVAVHLYGQPADLDALQAIATRHGVPLIEDCAQAHGAQYHGRRVGTFGALSCFSFYPTKNLGALGDGGAVAGNDRALRERVRLLREYGWSERYHSTHEGWNTRLDEMQAAFLRVFLTSLDAENARRRALAARYATVLTGSAFAPPPERAASAAVYHLYVVESEARAAHMAQLREAGVGTMVHYPLGIHQQRAFAAWAPKAGLPVTERLTSRVLSLPMYPQLSEAAVDSVGMAVRALSTSA